MGEGQSDKKDVCERIPAANSKSVALMVRIPRMVLASLVLGLCCGCSFAARGNKVIAARLGYEGCRVSKPLTIGQIMAKDMSGGYEGSRAHRDWEALIAKYASGDQVYFIDQRRDHY